MPSNIVSNSETVSPAETDSLGGCNTKFTTDDDLAERIESRDITVEDGTATTTFTVSEGESITLSLVSYTKPGPGWSPETEPQQEFVDAETRTFESGTHTLTVDLPKAETNATD